MNVVPRTLAVVGIAILCLNSSRAALITVTSGQDSGPGTLREAIAQASNDDTINFASGVTNITLTTGELLIEKHLKILGPGANSLTVQRSSAAGTQAFRIFDLAAGNYNVTLSGLALVNGNALNGDGGAISNKSTGAVAIVHCAIYSSAAKHGGGIYNQGVLNIVATTISANRATDDGTGFSPYGGGLYVASTGKTTVTNCTISANTAPSGGGIFSSGTLTLTSTTIAGNTASVVGGGLSDPSGGSSTARNTIIAKNVDAAGSPDVNGPLTSQGYNLIGSNGGATIVAKTGDKIGTPSALMDPLLGPLQNNGGPTQTRALLANSPALDAGHSSTLNIDQRNLSRPVDLISISNAPSGDGSDIGAVEMQTAPGASPSPTPSTTKRASGLASCQSIAMGVAAADTPSGIIYSYFTTYDGYNGVPLNQDNGDGTVTFSQELRPRLGSPSTYEADFITYNASGSAIDYGSLVVNVSGADTDANGLPDVVQASKSGNTSVSGTAKSDVFGTYYTVTGSLSRQANSTTGYYSVTLTSSNAAPIDYSGQLYLLNASGTFDYSRSPNSAKFSLAEQMPSGFTRVLTGATTFTVVDTNSVKFPQFTVKSNDGFTFTVQPFTLSRSAKRYVGSFRLTDGSPDTYWPDYVDWLLEITDTNDSDGDGIPDLSDAMPDQSQLFNISTRLNVLSGDNVLIAGFIVKGTPGSTKQVMIRALGPSLVARGVSAPLTDPLLELHLPDGSVITNDDWWSDSNAAEIPNGFQPADSREAILIANVPVGSTGLGNCTAIVRGAHGETGVALVEAYDLSQGSISRLANISTRGLVEGGDKVMIAGVILGVNAQVLVRAIGPSLPMPGKLTDPMLELHDGNGATLEANDNWVDSPNKQAIIDSTIPPTNSAESAILRSLAPGNYTAIVRGVNNATGIALVEAYALN